MQASLSNFLAKNARPPQWHCYGGWTKYAKKNIYKNLDDLGLSTLPLGHELEAEWLRAMSLSNGGLARESQRTDNY
jgi:hypothetical protein